MNNFFETLSECRSEYNRLMDILEWPVMTHSQITNLPFPEDQNFVQFRVRLNGTFVMGRLTRSRDGNISMTSDFSTTASEINNQIEIVEREAGRLYLQLERNGGVE